MSRLLGGGCGSQKMFGCSETGRTPCRPFRRAMKPLTGGHTIAFATAGCHVFIDYSFFEVHFL
jgi:hypothetical protein